jgi:hypothetical protein
MGKLCTYIGIIALGLALSSSALSQGYTYQVKKDIQVRHFFKFMDSVVAEVQQVVSYPISEHIIVRANPWIVANLVSFDYYENMKKGRFIYDQDSLVVIPAGSGMLIPNEARAAGIADTLAHTLIDVNIPEYRLRIYEFGSLKFTFHVRVGQDKSKYLGTVGRKLDLRTPVGEGQIYRISREPIFIKLNSGKRYTTTTRDDGKVTKMPMIPWLDPELDGRKPGAMIHPTTNVETLDQSYSHGCVGLAEYAAWIVYYHAPIGTAVKYRYCLNVKDENGTDVQLKDVYGYGNDKCKELSIPSTAR